MISTKELGASFHGSEAVASGFWMVECFLEIEDPWCDHTKRHLLLEIICLLGRVAL